jgi:Cu(I)/Ag(I) efflux system protein CusF
MKKIMLNTLTAVAMTVALAANALAQPQTEGEVRRIDKDAKKITLRHGPIKNLDMPAMTMVFRVKDAALLEKVNVGDKIKFHAERISGGYAVTDIEPAK